MLEREKEKQRQTEPDIGTKRETDREAGKEIK